MVIQECKRENIDRYGEIYAEAFACEPWNDHWKVEDAVVHIKELMESGVAYGLECVIDGEIVGFVLGTSMMFSYGRTFEINDLAVDPAHHREGIGRKLTERILEDVKKQGMAGVHLITSHGGILPGFYEEFGFKKESEVILMGKEL